MIGHHSEDWHDPDYDDGGSVNYTEEKKHTKLIALVLLGIALVVVLVALLRLGFRDESVPTGYQQAMSNKPPAGTDAQAVKQITDLKAYNISLQQSVTDLTTQRDQAQADATKAEGNAAEIQSQLDSLTTDHKTLQAQYDDLYAVYQDSPKYDQQLKKEQGFHISLGGMLTVPTEDWKSPTPSLLITGGVAPWNVIVGVGYNLKASSPEVSFGFTWRIL